MRKTAPFGTVPLSKWHQMAPLSYYRYCSCSLRVASIIAAIPRGAYPPTQNDQTMKTHLFGNHSDG